MWRLLLVPAMGVAVVGQLSVTGTAGAATTAATATARTAATGAIAPNPVNALDCNGYSPKYKSVRPFGRSTCTDPRNIENGKPYVRLRYHQQQLRRAGQLRVPADQRRPLRAAKPAADE
jgi:hypothetical protein